MQSEKLMESDQVRRKKHSIKTLTLYAMPALPTAMLLSPVGVILPSFYAKHTEIGLAGVGAVLLIGRLFDAFSDPIIGVMSDRTKSPFGRRKPWMAVGAVIAAISVFFLFNPPQSANTAYFLLGMMGLFLGYTMLDIPHRSWGVELSRDYKERSRISMFVGCIGTLGFVLFVGIPQLPIFESRDLTPETLNVMRWTIIGLMPLVLMGLLFAPQGEVLSTRRLTIGAQAITLFKNRPFLIFTGTLITAGIGNGMHLALTYLFLDAYLQIPDAILTATLIYVLSQLAGLPITLMVMNRLGKHKTWAISQLLYVLFHIAVVFLSPGDQSLLPFLVLTALSGLATSVLMIAPMSILGDIVDYDALKTGQDRAGNFFALMTLIMKANMAIGGALGFMLLSAIGFDANGDNSPGTLKLFVLIFIVGPQIFGFISACLIAVFPIDKRRHDIISRRLAQRHTRAEREKGLTPLSEQES